MRAFRSLLLSILLCLTLVNAGFIDDLLKAIKNGATCASCHGLLAPLKLLARFGDKPFTKTFTAVCKVATSFDDDVCEGSVGTQAPIIAHSLRSIDPFGPTARKLCDTLFGLCQPPAVNKYDVPFPKPRPANPKKFASTGRQPFQVVHFSDIHIDRSYTPGADSVCSKPLCCRNWADQKGPVVAAAGPMGSRNCDTPTALAQNFLRTITSNNKFSIFTGDVIEASVWLADRGHVTHDLELFTGEMNTLPQVPVYAALGNHESAPTNSFPRNTTKKANSQWVFDALSKGWEPAIGTEAAQQVSHLSGSYSIVVPGTNLRLISINTVYWYKGNYWLYDSDRLQPDPNGLLSFTISQLQAAEDAGQRAWIIGHIPPGGRGDVLRDQSNYFDQIIQRYSHVIAGQFYGHSHQDEFIVGYSDYSRQTADTAVTYALLAPAITPRGSNPGFKVYDVDPDTYEIVDVKVYRTDISSPEFHVEPVWELTYSARETYGPFVGLEPQDSLGPAFWHRLTEAFERDDALFDVYRRFKRAVSDAGPCDAECKRVSICDMRALRVENICTVSKIGVNFRRDLEGGQDDHAEVEDECEGPGFNFFFRAAAERLTDEDMEVLRKELEAIGIPDDIADLQLDLEDGDSTFN
ncbi:sphingomyelin phosphodiesterase [Coprinopsis cinerea okayama7|uniref:Sphingomyelin phosphodiesterase n=1 Tax=Coprinopsis cinerea (strain Okayama-7 / 130 / ATCC MYA-4618 / FGSC 9003) TaxID=240176 RepID=A8NBX0_COPC7|nr:sphingomyelin phosphodiesterase [Coprinopsis cinerea okayama7\|eukprot:XP_001832330.1 sphingomyelin phosphodiesterase [Coprinopsis cinerea okayama7\